MKLQIHNSESASEVEKYLHGKHSLEAYYSADGQEIVGDWGGKGAAHLGLKGVVKKEEFGRLVNNLHPFTGEQLTDRMRADRRPGFDMVWNVPKSVSLVYARTKDERIIQGFRETITQVMEIAQKQAAVRVRTGDKNRDEDRVTEWLVTAEHIHLLARPEDGYSDPHLHMHLYVPNVSYDPVEKKFKALQMGRIHAMADDLEKLATKLFAEKLQAIGFKLVPTEHAFEIEGFNRDLIEKFSRRTTTIEETAERLGISDPAQKAKLAALTRQNKLKDAKFSDFEPIWWGSLTPEDEKAFKAAQEVLTLSREAGLAAKSGADQIGREPVVTKAALGSKEAAWAEERILRTPDGYRISMNRATRPRPAEVANVEANEHDFRAVAQAIEHLLERNSVVTDCQIVAEASTNWCLDKTTVAGLWKAVEKAPLLRREKDGWLWMTTPEVLAEEKRITERCLSGRGRFGAVNPNWRIRDEELTEEQRAAALHVLTSGDFITAIKGNPGVGKTRVLKEIKLGMEAGMSKLVMLAPWAATAHEVLRKEGFEDAQTVASLLANPAAQEAARGAVWMVDEAALLSTREADALIALADRLEARLVLVGDSGQHLPVQRGQAFRLLEEQGMMQTARIKDIKRQQGEYRHVVELILSKHTDEAIELLQKMGDAHEMGREERRQAIAAEYVAALERGESVRVTAPTHVERRDVMETIRAELKARGHLKEARRRTVTKNLRWTDTQKGTPAEYKIGMRVEIESPVKGFRLHEKVEVVGVRDDMVRVRSLHPNETKTRPLPLEAPEAFSVFGTVEENSCERDVLLNLSWTDAEKSDAEHYTVGQVVQINRHLKDYALGEQLEVVSVANDGVKAVNSAGRHKLLPLQNPRAFSVHEKDRLEICEGELIRITGNSRTAEGQRLCNGSSFKVDYISHDGAIVLENGHRLGRNFKNLDWGYALTSHAIQGQTFDRILVSQSAELSAAASDMRQFLVSISRGRKGSKLYTDSLERLRENVAYERNSPMATELFQEHASRERDDVATERERLSVDLGQFNTAGMENEPENVQHQEPVMPERRNELAMGM